MNTSVESRIEKIKSAFLNAKANKDSLLIESTIEECDEVLKILNENLSRASSTGEKQHCVSEIGCVKSYKQRLHLLSITGAGFSRKKTARDRVKWEDLQSAFQGRMKTGVIINLHHIEPTSFLEDCNAIFNRRIKEILRHDEAIKVNSSLCIEFTKMQGDEEVKATKFFTTKNEPIYNNTNLNDWFKSNIQEPLLNELTGFTENGSGWALDSIINLQIAVNKFTPQIGSSYIELPKEIFLKKACINVKNADSACFAWAVTSALFPAEQSSDRTSSYPHYGSVLKLSGIQFPMTIKQIPRFEKQNEISINVYILKKKKNKFSVLPTYLTKAKQEKHVNLLLIQDKYEEEDDDEEDDLIMEQDDEDYTVKYHFVWIKNLSRLVSRQLSDHKCRKYFCDRCLHYFYTQNRLDLHYKDCVNMNECKVRLPTGEFKELKFKNYKNKLKVPFVIYADLECILEPCNQKKKYQNHKPYYIGYYVKCSYDPTLSFYKAYRGDDCIEWFVRELQNFAEDVETVFQCPIPMEKLSLEQELQFQNAKICHICEKPFKQGEKKVRDHNHCTGAYRNAAHEDCNLNHQDMRSIPVILHNLSGYDSHFIIKNLACDLKGRVNVLPINKERYISFTKCIKESTISFRFIDSFRFLNTSLDKLASYLPEYPNLKAEFSNFNEEQINLLTRKGIYPYDYITSAEKFQETKLPDKRHFYNKLTDEEISDDDFKHAHDVWNAFKIQNLDEYTQLYLKTDIMLLTDVFEKFRTDGMNTYNLDAAHYFTLAGFSFDCMLKYTKITLELFDHIDYVLFVERGIRGGLSQCSKRYSKANNKYAPDYDPSQPSMFLLYTDINNQYGWGMCQFLPYGGFRWLSETEIQHLNVTEVSDEANTGYFLEVDIKYPQNIHDDHRDLPMCPEHDCAPGTKDKRLLGTLHDKSRYVIHYRALKQAMKHGLKVTKIHRVLEFKQAPWLKPYIELNTEFRKHAKCEFEKNFFKLMINAIFGKTIENIRKHVNIKLVAKWSGRYSAEALIAKPEFKSSTIFTKNFAAIELNKTEIYFNKPIYVGMAILDIAKTKLYEFHYDYMKPKFGDKCTVLYTDTDSLIYEIVCPDLYSVIRSDAYSKFDTSDYDEQNIWGIPRVNKKVLGYMKDELAGKVMSEFAGLRSKMYAIRVNGQDQIKKSKGVKTHIVKKRITFDDYLNCLNNLETKTISQNIIASDKHTVSSICQHKIGLSYEDKKRHLIKDSYETLPYGHYSIMDVDN